MLLVVSRSLLLVTQLLNSLKNDGATVPSLVRSMALVLPMVRLLLGLTFCGCTLPLSCPWVPVSTLVLCSLLNATLVLMLGMSLLCLY